MLRLFPVSFSLLVLAAIAGCATEPPSAPPPVRPIPAPLPIPRPAPTPTPARPAQSDWRDWTITPGTWAWRQDARGSIALFGRVGEDADLTIRCDRQRSRIYVSRRAAASGPLPLTVRTSSELRALTALPAGGTPPYVAVELGVRDPLLDAIGYSRGRFIVEGGGMSALVIPAWPEILRVTEDCRS